MQNVRPPVTDTDVAIGYAYVEISGDPRFAEHTDPGAILALYHEVAARYGRQTARIALHRAVAQRADRLGHDLPVPVPTGRRRGLPVYADLVDLADAGCEDGYLAAGGHVYLAGVEGDPDMLVYCPAGGGSCYDVRRLLTDDHYRLVVKAQAARRTA